MNGGNFEALDKYVRAANYLTAAQIFLGDNVLMERDLTPDDIKPRLLGHWGSGPGINFTYAHLNRAIQHHDQEMLFVMGPGHAFPSLQANLFLEGTLGKYYPQASHTEDGIKYITRNFSWPYGFPSHSNPGTPGVILEGGELGYSLATAYGAALDNPGLVVACMIGDGEAETGPTSGAWNLNKLVSPCSNGVVLPILHVNGYKISGPTVYGRMSNDELTSLFTGFGYDPRIVEYKEGENINERMATVMEESMQQISEWNHCDDSVSSPKLPMIILKTPKGWTGVKELNGKKVEGNFLAHQVVLTEAKTDSEQLQLLNNWLHSYRFEELFSKDTGFSEEVKSTMPREELQMGQTKHSQGSSATYRPLKLPHIEFFAEDASKPGTIGSSSMRRAGLYLNEVFKLNKEEQNFRLMSPDETYSNKLDQVFETTNRAWVWPREDWDEDMAPNGRVMEILSEHNLQGLTQGYVLTGRHAIFASYEAFIQVIVSMTDQYAKFIHVAREIDWRGDFASLNYILTSSGWRQEHNGFSHQNPGFIDDVLQRQGNFINVYFPPDGNSTLAVLERMLSSEKQINVLVAGKTLEPRWLTPHKAKENLDKGIMIWEFASQDDPDIVMSAAGDYLAKEALAAISIVHHEAPDIRMRFVNIMALNVNGLGTSENPVSSEYFRECFTEDKPVICNFHGYPQTMKQALFDYAQDREHFSVHGYTESGSTTTPFDMHVRNRTSRYHLAIEVFEKTAMDGRLPREQAEELIEKYQHKLEHHREYIKEHGVDPSEIEDWKWHN